MSVESLGPVVTQGIGRRDYSENIEVATVPFIRRGPAYWQERFFYSLHYTGLDALTFPEVYEVPLGFLVDSVLQNTAPKRPYLFYLVNITTDRNTLVGTALNRYENLAAYQAQSIMEHLGTVYGYESASLQLRKGIATIEAVSYTHL